MLSRSLSRQEGAVPHKSDLMQRVLLDQSSVVFAGSENIVHHLLPVVAAPDPDLAGTVPNIEPECDVIVALEYGDFAASWR